MAISGLFDPLLPMLLREPLRLDDRLTPYSFMYSSSTSRGDAPPLSTFLDSMKATFPPGYLPFFT